MGTGTRRNQPWKPGAQAIGAASSGMLGGRENASTGGRFAACGAGAQAASYAGVLAASRAAAKRTWLRYIDGAEPWRRRNALANCAGWR